MTDTGSITHAELAISVSDIAAVHRRLQGAGSDLPSLLRLDGRLTQPLKFGAFGLYITTKQQIELACQ